MSIKPIELRPRPLLVRFVNSYKNHRKFFGRWRSIRGAFSINKPRGGYIINPKTASKIMRNAQDASPIRSVAKVVRACQTTDSPGPVVLPDAAYKKRPRNDDVD